eukprot:TRINITY_DN3867_c0_g1_i3.p1 TRINITY_DN3867_c0_g1~~TRINITY_DN3867_c0_g1_i3.p1  ORF type:complete len:479 (+),score=68.16 TRINITY_DN3867_c0_g1_i3:82-1518(+)
MELSYTEMSRSFLVFLFLVIASQIVSAVHKQCGTHNLHKASSLLKSRVASTDDGSACLENVVCDDPANIAAYSSVIEKKNQEKLTINARVYIPLNEHNESLVSHKTTKEQIELISSAFSEFHVDLNVQIENITIPSVYYAVVLPYICKKDMLSNGVVNIECNIEENGWDGGDGICKDPAKIEACQKPTAQSDSQSQCDCVVVNFDGKDCTNSSNAKCDPECNYHQFDWDHGDCCQYNKDTTECRDPNASLDQRAWMTSLELKERLGWDNIRSLNTMVVRSQVISGSVVAGVAYYPWSNTSGTSGEDGILIDYRYWGVNKEYLSHGASWIHEVGHALGLWHTFRSVTEFDEASNCTETCQQTDDRAQGGMRSGDLCSDTPPEPLIYECKESVDCSKDSEVSCGSCLNSNFRLLKNNYMNYVAEDGLCKDKTFTLQQKARMRCYLDLLRSGWISNGMIYESIHLQPIFTVSCLCKQRVVL